MNPVCAFTPAVAVFFAVAVEHMSFAFGFVDALHPHGFGDADGCGAFFGVSEGDGFFCGQLDGEVDGSRGWGDGVEAECLFRSEVYFSILLGDPFLSGVDDSRVFAPFCLEDFGVLNFRVTFQAFDEAFGFAAFGPEIESVDVAV